MHRVRVLQTVLTRRRFAIRFFVQFYIDLVLTGLKDAKPLDGRVLISMEMGGVRERREKCLSRVGRTIRHTFAPTRPVGNSWTCLEESWIPLGSVTDSFLNGQL